MATDERPYFSSKQRYRQLLRLAKACNGAELLVDDDDWDVLLECIPGSAKFVNDPNGLVHLGRRWRCMPNSKKPEGTWYLSGQEPQRIVD